MALFRVASASEYLAITGWGVDDVKLVKKAWVFPGQRCKKFSIAPVNYEFNVNAMSAEKLPFALPAVFTIGPRADDPAALLTYAKLVASSRRRHCFADFVPLVRGIVEGEARVLAASMTMEEIFQGSKAFKQAVFDKVQLELNQFGLFIYNANVKQLVDVPGQKYFSYLGQKKQHEAANQAKADVAAAKLKGDVGEKNMEGLTKQNEARVEAETKMEAARQQGRVKKEEERARAEVRLFETERKAETEKAESELRKVMAGWERQARVAEVEATKAVAMREAELQAEVEKRNAARQTEKLKAEHLTKAIIDSEVKVQQVNADLHRRQTAAAALLYEKEKEAEARKAAAEAELFARQKEADAQLYAKQKEAKGLAAMGKAHGAYISSVLEAVGGDYGALRDYLMVSSGVYQDMARINADAVRGLEPNITVWSNGAAAAGGMKEVAGVYSMLPSVLPMLHEQTGMATPARVGSSAASTQSDAN